MTSTPPLAWAVRLRTSRELSPFGCLRLWFARRLLGIAARVWPTGYPWGEA